METSTEKLIRVLEKRNDPRLAHIIARAKQEHYNDYKSDLLAPIVTLVADLRGVGYDDIADMAVNGEFDGTEEESAAWARSAEGQNVFAELMRVKKPPRSKPKGFG